VISADDVTESQLTPQRVGLEAKLYRHIKQAIVRKSHKQ